MIIHLPTATFRHGLTKLDVLITLTMLVVTAGIFLPATTHNKGRASRIVCVNNLKQIGTAFRLFANVYDGDYPYQVLTRATNVLPAHLPSATEFNRHDPGELWKIYLVAQSEMGSPRILVCPDDKRSAAGQFSAGPLNSKDRFDHPTRRLSAVSYFYGLSATESDPSQFAAGDRNLTTVGTDTEPGRTLITGQVDLSTFPTTSSDSTVARLRWSPDQHKKAGNITFSDGSVQQLTSGKLRDAVANTRSTNAVVWLPNLPASLK